MITDFIIKNHGCKVEDVVEGVAGFISRKTVFKILNELTSKGVIINKKYENRPNKRDHELFVVMNNLLVSVPRELDEFKTQTNQRPK
jgi:DNA-binding HxlR family transcriptional regulator